MSIAGLGMKLKRHFINSITNISNQNHEGKKFETDFCSTADYAVSAEIYKNLAGYNHNADLGLRRL